MGLTINESKTKYMKTTPNSVAGQQVRRDVTQFADKMSSGPACGFCTFINELGSTICDACGRSLELPSINLNPTGIECPQCTYQNPYGSVSCLTCGSTIQSVNAGTSFVAPTDKICPICVGFMDAEFQMPECDHIFCLSCAKQHFTIKIMECGINNFRCPIDVCTTFDELISKSDFFKDLKLVLSNVLDDKTIKIFVTKTEILDIMDKPGFMRCAWCTYAFINKDLSKLTKCPNCSERFCSECGIKWVVGHADLACSSGISNSSANENGKGDLLTHTNAACPQCKYKYFLQRGGCMHLTCSQCSYEYCEFCFTKITGKGKSCDFKNCSKGKSLHGHHPRNCMYYVQEMELTKLEQLLKKNGVCYTFVQSCKTAKCKMKVNVSIEGTWIDSECGQSSSASYNNMCLNHYKWHLGELMKQNDLDPVDVMNNLECSCELQRNHITFPLYKTGNDRIEDEYTPALRNLVKTQIPLKKIPR